MTLIWSRHVSQADICKEGLILCLGVKLFASQCKQGFLTVSKGRSVLLQMSELRDGQDATLRRLHFRKRFSTHQLCRTMQATQQHNQRLVDRSSVGKLSPRRHWAIDTCVHFQCPPALHRYLNIGGKRHPYPVGRDTHLSWKGVCNSVARTLHLRSQPSHPIAVWWAAWLNPNLQEQLVPQDLVAPRIYQKKKKFCWLVNANYPWLHKKCEEAVKRWMLYMVLRESVRFLSLLKTKTLVIDQKL